MRYVRIDLEYDEQTNPLRTHSFAIMDNIKRILREDMPYVRVIFSRDAPNVNELDSSIRGTK